MDKCPLCNRDSSSGFSILGKKVLLKDRKNIKDKKNIPDDKYIHLECLIEMKVKEEVEEQLNHYMTQSLGDWGNPIAF